MTREQHAALAIVALDAFRKQAVGYANTKSDLEDAIGDLMSDLMHLAFQEGFDVALLLRRSSLAFFAEITDKEKIQ